MDRLPGLRDVADAAGVSVGLASMALNGRPGVAKETREYISRVAAEMNYRADPAARSLRMGENDSIALLIRNMGNPYFLDIFNSVEDQAYSVNKTVMAIDTQYSIEREMEHINRLIRYRISSLAIAPAGSGKSIKLWLSAHPSARVVVINASTTRLRGVVHVGPDDRSAVYAAVSHLADLGHRRVAFFSAPREVMSDRSRLSAYRSITREFGIEDRVVESPLDLDSVRKAAVSVLSSSKPPTAVIMNSDYTAHAVYFAARDLGIRVGADLSVIGHDNLPTSSLLDPPLTTIDIDRRRVGIEVAKRLIDPTITADHVEPTRLIVRNSTGPPR